MKKAKPLGLRFNIISRAFKKEVDLFITQSDLTSVQFGVLGQLDRLGETQSSISQRDLETAMHVTHPTMTELLKKLEKKGFITVCPDETDRRRKCISATEKAVRFRENFEEADRKAHEKLLDGLSAEQIASLEEITAVMLKNICPSERKNKEDV